MTAAAAAIRAALIRAIAMGESEPEGMAPGSGYNKLCGWHPGDPSHTFSDFSRFPDWPGIVVNGVRSHAAGRVQWEPRTYADVAKKLGLTDFTPASQDRAAWYLASEVYRAHTGRDLETDLSAGRVEDLVTALRSTWPSLSPETFLDRLRTALREQMPVPAPAPLPPPNPAPAPSPHPPQPLPAPSVPPAPSPTPAPVHPGWGTAGASGIALALVTLLVWLLSLDHLAVPGGVQDALVTLLTAAAGFHVHKLLSRPR